jgi:hypothetical protein
MARAGGFLIEQVVSTTSGAAEVFRAVGQADRWWSSKHTFSGSAANLSLKTESGGCFCEKWGEGSVEHGQVVQTQVGQLVRLHAVLGPLLEMGVGGVLTFSIKPAAKVPRWWSATG